MKTFNIFAGRIKFLLPVTLIFLPVLFVTSAFGQTAGDGSSLNFDSILDANRMVTLTARTTGIIKKVYVKEGERVNKGKILLRLEDDEAAAGYEKAKAKLDYAEKTLKWDKMLFEKEALSERRYFESGIKHKEAVAAFKQAEHRQKQTRLTAPFDGIIIIENKFLEQGLLIITNTPVLSIVDFDPLSTTIYVPEQHFHLFQIGSKAEIRSRYNDELKAKAEVVEKSPVIDPASSTNKIKLILQGSSNGLIPGMHVIVSFTPGS